MMTNLFFLDAQYRITWTSLPPDKHFGMQILGRRAWKIVEETSPEAGQLMKETYRRCTKTGEPQEFLIRWTTPTGIELLNRGVAFKVDRDEAHLVVVSTRLDTSVSALTRRELEVVQLLAEGANTEAIARKLGVSPPTVRSHSQKIRTKLGLHTADELVAWSAKQLQLL